MLYCSKCDTYSVPGSLECLNCSTEFPDPDRYDWVGGIFILSLFALVMWGMFWIVYEPMIFRG
jgi:hypothetical protein